MLNTKGILNKLKRAFILQGILIAIAVLLSVFLAKVVIDEILIKNALIQEADYYWENFHQNPAINLPDTKNLQGFKDKNQLFDMYAFDANKPAGFYQHLYDNHQLVLYISEKHGEPLYLVYNRDNVDALVAYYGLVPLSIILIFLYIGLLITYRFSRKSFSPISRLARDVNQIDFSQHFLDKFELRSNDYDIDEEIQVLYDAIVNMGERLEAFIERERNFTRDASHEMRTPLTVINIAADMLLSEQEFSAPAKKSILRIKSAASDMLELTEAFLLLARETDNMLLTNRVNVNDVIAEEIERINIIKDKKPIDINQINHSSINIHASDKALSVLFGNLLRNAIDYTEKGQVEVVIEDSQVTIRDSGKGMEESQISKIFSPYYRGSEDSNPQGHGVGMTIVKRFSDRFNWPISISSELGKGTAVTISFEQSLASE